ncbi:hypothetical protein [Treponema vincentii]|uniref:hypothetical protein n=1 Tax=Treponema vincentii TaxID=69710 RepID=UPI0020A5A7AF|nr:hypothetical protein [Treponema vincentii]UTC48544.1 hypothetical protein E4N73_06720 [Treponema vincentii]
MKTLRLISVSILFAALGIIFTACNQSLTAGQGTGTVRIVIDNGASRAVNAEGMPVFDGSNTTITVTGEDGTELKKASGATPITLTLDIGKKINIKVVVKADAGEWRGTKEHTVTAGTNTVAVKLSKAPKDVANLLFSITGTHTSGSNIVSLSMKNGKKLLDGILINNSAKPLTARDSIGRLYLFYQDRFSVRHFKRFDVEGKEDTSFPGAALLTAVLHCTDIAVDTKTDTLFLVARTSLGWKIYYTNKENSFVPLLPDSIARIDSAVSDIHAVAAYNGIVYLAVTKTGSEPLHVMACKADLSGPALALTKMDTKPLQKLRTAPSFGNNSTKCIGLFADADGVYCLLSDQNLYNGNLYALGQIVRYQYSGSAFTGETKIGLNPKAKGTDGIPFDAQYFSNPVGFIGYDEEKIYIADDGVGIQYVNENYHVNGNKNRIAAFNRKTSGLTFTDTDATWYGQFPNYEKPNTKVLLWQENIYGMYYWTSTDGTEAFSEANKLFADTSSEQPTDIFCYDQDGNLYILWNDGTGYKVRRFPVKMDGSYDKTAARDLNLRTSDTVDAIAVDVSNGRNYLYYYTETPTPTNKKIERFKWEDVFFNSGSKDTAYTITLPSGKVTALAANKDGVFVATKETYPESGIDKYRLKVKKYAKTGSLTAPDSEITLVDNAVSYTDVTTGNPIPAPSLDLNHEPNTPCHQYQETINGLQIGNGKLYGISSKLHRKWILYSGGYRTDVFKHSSKLYEIGDTKEALPNEPLVTKEKPAGAKIGYGFYRFIAVKYDEQERIKCIIASDSAWGDGVSSMNGGNSDRIVEFNLKDMVFGEDKKSGGPFSKTFNTSGFAWY